MLGRARTMSVFWPVTAVAAFALLATATAVPRPAAAAATTVALPDEFVGGYVEAWQSATYPDDVPHANMTLIAFATTTSNRNVRMSYHMPPAALRDSIAANTAAGEPTILSLGGSGGWHAPTTTAHVATMANDLIAIIEDYGFSGLDVNFESGTSGFTESNARYTADMMRRVHDHVTGNGQAFSLSIAPYGANPDGQANNTVSRTYQEIMRQNVDIIDFVGFQYYNTGFPVTTSWVRNVLDHWKAEIPGMANDQWALGFLRAHDWGGADTPYATMVDIWNDLEQSHPGIRGVWTWGVNEKETATGYGFFDAFEPVIDSTISGTTSPAIPAPESAPTPEATPVAAADPTAATGDSSTSGNEPSGDESPDSRFSDVRSSVHRDAIERMALDGVISGYPGDTFRPTERLTRGQLASLFDRAFDLDPAGCDHRCPEVSDIATSVHADAIRAMVAAGVAHGYSDGTYGPHEHVTRGQVASFLANALDLHADAGENTFDDTDDSAHAAAIAAIESAGITSGRTESMYAPYAFVRRGQMASFLDRATG